MEHKTELGVFQDDFLVDEFTIDVEALKEQFLLLDELSTHLGNNEAKRNLLWGAMMLIERIIKAVDKEWTWHS